MAKAKTKDSAVSSISRRLRAAGPVPDVVKGGASVTEGESARIMAELKLGGEVARLKERLAGRGFEFPMRVSELSSAEAARLSEAVDSVKIPDGDFDSDEIKRAFWRSLQEYEAKSADSERVEQERKRQREVIMQLADVATAAERLSREIEEGRITVAEIPMVAKRQFSEMFMRLVGEGFGTEERDGELKAQLVAQQAEIARLRAAVPETDSERAALEAEVARMVFEGRAPEAYSDREDKSEKPTEFLFRVYGRYLQKGREAIYLHDLRKLDLKFVQVITKACSRAGIELGDFVPRKSARTDKVLQELGLARAKEATKAVTALRMRKSKD